VDQKEVLVFDGLFGVDTIVTMYEFLRTASFRWIARDSYEHGHSVRWKLEFALEATQTAFFADVAALVNRVVAKGALRLEEIYANFNVFGEVHYPHIDSSQGVSVLYYANKEWEVPWQGETFFFEGGEPLFVVAPRPGRVILFDGSIAHRGTPPARDCYEPRLNVVFKYKCGDRAAREKPERVAPTSLSGLHVDVVRQRGSKSGSL